MNQKIAELIQGAATIAVIAGCVAGAAILTGCAATGTETVKAAGGKNLGLDGYVMYGAIETANSETGTPTGKMIMGRVTYKSRRVGIPADQKVPNTGNFKSTKTKSLFGTEEHIIEYDWTACSDADNKAAEERLQKLKEEAEKTEKEKAEESSASAESDQSETPAAGNAEKEAGMGAKQ